MHSVMADHAAQKRFVAVYESSFGRLRGMAVSMLHDEELAEEVVQDVFVRVLRRWDDLDGRSWLRAYLHTSVVNGCRAEVRRRDRDAGRPARLRTHDHGEDPLEAVVRRSSAAQVGRAMATLSDRQRACLVCRYVLGLTEVETAQVLGVAVGTVRTHLHRGTAALRQAMEDG